MAGKRDNLDDGEALSLVVTEHGPTFRARAFSRLSGAARDAVEQVEWATAVIAKAEAQRAEAVEDARSMGVSWGVLAPALGMTAEGARLRYGFGARV